MERKATATAHPNLAFVKYWGRANADLNIPQNSSISVNLSSATTTTSVAFLESLNSDVVKINGRVSRDLRVSHHLDRIRQLAGINENASVESWNDFPASAGIASSASGFAALSLAASKAAGLDLDERQLSILARKGSGSACRSIPDGFVEWVAGTNDGDSYARQVAPPDHWDIRIFTVIVDEGEKPISSSKGHQYAETSPFYHARLAAVPRTLHDLRQALLCRDFSSFGKIIEREAVAMHCVAMTSDAANYEWLSGIYYWQPATVHMVRTVQTWRRQGLEVYFTIDAGPNIHLVCEERSQASLERALEQELRECGGRYLLSVPAEGARILSER